MPVRLRDLRPMLKAKGLTAYQLAKLSGGRISMSAAYRLTDPDVTESSVEFKTLAALIDVLGVQQFDELFTRDDEKPPTPKRARRATRTP